MKICELCQKQKASVHVTDITGWQRPRPSVKRQHLCEGCAEALNLPSSPPSIQQVPDIWKLLKQSAQKALKEGPSCPDCGMSLHEFRSKGRFGCPKDYEVFRAHIEPLLLRVHNAQAHQGRLPGENEEALKLKRQLSELRTKLETAIREEAYESAARLRDEITELEAQPKGS